MDCPVDGTEPRMADRSGKKHSPQPQKYPKSLLKDLLEFD